MTSIEIVRINIIYYTIVATRLGVDRVKPWN